MEEDEILKWINPTVMAHLKRNALSMRLPSQINVDDVVSETRAIILAKVRSGGLRDDEFPAAENRVRFVCGILRNVAKAAARRTQNEPLITFAGDPRRRPIPPTRVEWFFEAEDLKDALVAVRMAVIQEAASTLQRADQVVLQAYIRGRPTLAELASQTGERIGTLRVRQCRAVDRLSAQLGNSACWTLYQCLQRRLETEGLYG